MIHSSVGFSYCYEATLTCIGTNKNIKTTIKMPLRVA